MIMERRTRFLAFFLILVLCLTLLPYHALADESDPIEDGAEVLDASILDEALENYPQTDGFAIEDGTIQGTVVDMSTQQPITAVVSLYRSDDMNTVLATAEASSETGEFTIRPDAGLSAGTYTLRFENNLYLTRTVDIEVTSESGLAIAYSIGLSPVGRTSGIVTDSATGGALSGVTVNVFSGDTLKTSTTTGADGRYSIETDAGIYTLSFVLSGYTMATVEASLGAISTTNDITMTKASTDPPQETDKPVDPDPEETPKPESTIASGACGANLTWTLTIDGVLTISGTGAMKDYTYAYTIPWYSVQDSIGQVIIEFGVTSIGSNAFSGCTDLRSITIPDSVTSIGSDAFNNCTGLSSVAIPNNVTYIGYRAFWRCTGLTSATIGSSVIEIDTYAFCGCTSLTNVTIPDNVTSIGFWAFYNCTGLTNVSIGSGVTEFGHEVFKNCTSLTHATIGGAVTPIGLGAFQNCTSLTSVAIGNGVTSIDVGAFNNCTSLTSVTIPDSVTSIGISAFSGCTNLTNVIIGTGVTEIASSTFRDCTGLTSVTIPDSVTSIVSYAFTGCISLTDVYYTDSEVDWEKIYIGYNYPLLDATIHYNSTGPESEQPSDNTNTNFNVQNPVTDSKSLLESYVTDWNTAYQSYVYAVNAAVYQWATTSDASREDVIQSQKAAMMAADNSATNRGGRYLSGSFPNDEIKNAAYEALATFLYDHVYSALDLSNVSAADASGAKLVNTIGNAIRSASETYKIGRVTINIGTAGIGAVGFGMMTCSSTQLPGLYSYAICSSTEQCNQAINSYVRELTNLEVSAIYQVYSAICEDVLGQSLDTLTTNYLTKKLQPYMDRLTSSGVGSLLPDLNSCYNYYQYVKQMMGWASGANTPENILSAMKGIEFEDASISNSAVKRHGSR